MELNDISKLASTAWYSSIDKPLQILKDNFAIAMRDMDIKSDPISTLFATPLLTNNTVPSNVMHIILGFVSEESYDAILNIGGREICNLHLPAKIPILGLVHGEANWPIVSTGYHGIAVSGIPIGAKIWALGIRLQKHLLHLVYETSVIPGLLVFTKGLALHIDIDKDCVYMPVLNSVPQWTPL